jgi:hypothetical protein
LARGQTKPVDGLAVKESEDYLGRTFMDIPRSVPSGVKLDTEDPPDRCFIPDKCLHTWHDAGASREAKSFHVLTIFTALAGRRIPKVSAWCCCSPSLGICC